MSRHEGLAALALVVVLLAGLAGAVGAHPAQEDPWRKVDARVRQALEQAGEAEFLVILGEQADLSGAASLPTKEARGWYVYRALKEVAGRTQGGVRAYLDAQGVPYRAYYIRNMIWVQAAGPQVVLALAGRPEVDHIEANPWVHGIVEPAPAPEGAAAPTTVEWNIAHVHAPEVWAMGYTGQGAVVAGNDTGIDWDHPALVNHYRPQYPGYGRHDFNWHDAIHSGGGVCGPDSPVPCDDHGHGTHTLGTIVGDDGGANQIGMAPGAQWIGCRNMNVGVGSPATYIECFEFFLAPYPIGNPGGADPSKAPHVINNSWGCPPSEGCSEGTLEPAVAALRAAGIEVVVSAGNYGSACSTVDDPPALYPQSFTVGATDSGDNIAGFSSRGPVTYGGDTYVKPDIAAPGVNIRSSVPGGGYEGGWSGTSMAGPHVAGLVALLISARPALAGNPDALEYAITSTAVPRLDAQCGDPNPPNNVYGWGIIDALAAVQQVMAQGVIEGTVREAATGNPIVGATVEMARPGGIAYQATTGPGGFYSRTLPAETYTVTAFAYGYLPETAAGVVIVTDTTTVQNFSLTIATDYVVSGTVTESGTGVPLFASVHFLGSPVTVWTDPATGFYQATVAEGTYTMRVAAALHRPEERLVVVDHDQTQNFALLPRPCILLVDDDENGPNVRPYYTAALDNLGYSYDVWDVATEGDPAESDMVGYRIVVWFTGYPWGNTFTSGNETAVAAYLDGGGNFFLSSEDYLYDFGLTPFGSTYLGISTFESDVQKTDVVGNAGNPIGDGLGPYYLTPPAGWSGSLWTDNVSGVASPFRWQSSGQNNSTNHDGGAYRTVFFAWPLEGLAGLGDRATVLGRIVDYFGGCAVPVPGGLVGQVTDAVTGQPLAQAEVTVMPGGVVLVLTDPSGHYTFTLPAGTYDVTAQKAGYLPQTAPDVVVQAGLTTTQDFALQPLVLTPSIVVSPTALSATLVPGESHTATLTISNGGDGLLIFTVTEAPAVPWLAEEPTSGVVDPGASAEVAVVLDAGSLGEGRYTATLEVQSNDPFTPSVPVAVTLTVLAGCAPVTGTTFTWTPGAPLVGQLITFTATAGGTPPITFTWDLGDGTFAEGAVVTHSYAQTGTFTVVLTATNCATATATAQHTVTVTAPPPCQAVTGTDFVWTPDAPLVGQPITFTAAASGTPPIVFSWDFGGITATGAVVTHTYSAAGSYTVTLVAGNCEDDTETAQHVVVVAEAPEEFKVYLPLVFRGD